MREKSTKYGWYWTMTGGSPMTKAPCKNILATRRNLRRSKRHRRPWPVPPASARSSWRHRGWLRCIPRKRHHMWSPKNMTPHDTTMVVGLWCESMMWTCDGSMFDGILANDPVIFFAGIPEKMRMKARVFPAGSGWECVGEIWALGDESFLLFCSLPCKQKS